MNDVVVGDGDGIDAGTLRGGGHVVERHRPVGGRRVDVEVGVGHTGPTGERGKKRTLKPVVYGPW
ncbi:hypothetical protein GCM10009017_06650 [Halarchaeum rubridurum]|uniref:Uncharacterized protein n=1 Tax=Halarchaeum rubridurum TaxID=489911 RepID=A0A830FTL8_9EURY|nr:hypothetical protein GCM10009017_06650 [Halarchaeum rubridurum]